VTKNYPLWKREKGKGIEFLTISIGRRDGKGEIIKTPRNEKQRHWGREKEDFFVRKRGGRPTKTL